MSELLGRAILARPIDKAISLDDRRLIKAKEARAENPQSRIVVTDSRVLVVGHSGNQAACVAVTAAVQTFAAIAQKLGIAESVTLNEEGPEPSYDVKLAAGDQAEKCIAGVMFAFYGIAKQAPGAILLNDSRVNAPGRGE